MTDEDKKRIVSEPPPPTDEIDGEWGDDDQTLVREVPEGVLKSQPAPPAAAVAGTAVAPVSVPAAGATATDEADEEEDDEEEDDEEEATDNEDDQSESDEDEHESVGAEHASAAAAASAAADWIPEWAPFAVLGLLVTASIVFGLGLVGGAGPEHVDETEAAPAASALVPAKKPSAHP
jgi:hypothetical protein